MKLLNLETLVHELSISAGSVMLKGSLAIPKRATGLVIFAHGSGSSRHSPRNQFVASQLQEAGLATLLFDLLTADEEAIDVYTRQYRFDLPRLAERLLKVTDWLAKDSLTASLSQGYFGASTGAAAALMTAAKRPNSVQAVVSRGGRPDLATDALAKVKAPCLLIVGSLDREVIALNQMALAQLSCEKKLELIQGASHLFEESGTLLQVAQLAKTWFKQHLAPKQEEAKRES